MPSLFVIQGRNKGSRYDLAAHEGAMSIGRDAGNAIQIEDNEVSRRHAEIRHIGDTLVVGDLKSSNGTYLNNRKIERAELTSGDHLQVGRTVFVFSMDRENERAIELVDIVSPSNDSDGSRIVRTIREDEAANAVASPDDTQNRWLARARSNLQVMYRTALAVSHTLDIDELLGRILQLIFEWVEADRGCIMLLDPETKQLRTKARRDRNVNAATSMAISRTILDYVLDHREGVLTSDAQDDDRFSSGNSVIRTGVREAICIPLQGRYDTVGVIYIDTTVPLAESIETGQHRFTDEHLKLMMAIGHQAALAVEDTTYYSAMVQSERLAAIGQTIATLSHHIKNILQGIRGGSYLVEMGLDNEDPAVLRKGWDIVARNQNKISSLVMDMLSFSKEREPDPLPSDLVALVSDIVETVQQRAAESKTVIHWEPPTAAIPRLLFDPEAMSRAVLNVVSNALDAVENRPDAAIGIRLDCQEQEKMVRITITDNGAGISADSLQDIFTLFVSTKGARGTGLGLTVSRKILREHGGNIQVTSQLGEGSEFVLTFPMTISESELSPERMRTIAESFADPDADAPTSEIP
ncbi:MAG: histidine kinase [Planctomycetaceae bacterium]|nr:MAG: histidine kinase [Planctomycetaceae bacterium]